MKLRTLLANGLSVANRSRDLLFWLCIFSLTEAMLMDMFEGSFTVEKWNAGTTVFALISFLARTLFKGGTIAYVHARLKTGKASMSEFAAAAETYFSKLLFFALISLSIYALLFAIGGYIFLYCVAIFGYIAPIGTVLVIGPIVLYYLLLMNVFTPFGIVTKQQNVLHAMNEATDAGFKRMLPCLTLAFLSTACLHGASTLVHFTLSFILTPGLFLSLASGIMGSFVTAYFGIVLVTALLQFYETSVPVTDQLA